MMGIRALVSDTHGDLEAGVALIYIKYLVSYSITETQ